MCDFYGEIKQLFDRGLHEFFFLPKLGLLIYTSVRKWMSTNLTNPYEISIEFFCPKHP
jgi:hypothetical protein